MVVDWLQVLQVPLRMAHGLQVIRSADALARREHQVRVFLRGGTARDGVSALESALGRAAAPGLSLVHLAAHKGLAGLQLRAAILRFAMGGRVASPARAWVARERSLARFALGATRALHSRAALVYELHNLEHVLAAETGRGAEVDGLLREERALARRAQGLLAISAPLAADAEAALEPARPIQVVPDGVDPRPFDVLAPPRLFEGEVLQLAYAGSLYTHKGVDSLFDMAAALARRSGNKNFVLRIAGGEPASELARLGERARDLAREGVRIELLGNLDPREVPAFLRGADLLVLPASQEARSQRYTSPLKLFEALASGVPIVAAASEAHRSVLEHGRTAWLAAGRTGEELAAAVQAAVQDPLRSRALARAARQEVERYTWDRRAEVLESALADAVAARG